MGRRPDPPLDAAVAVAIRAAVGPAMQLRADANQRWTLEQAMAFAHAAASAELEVRLTMQTHLAGAACSELLIAAWSFLSQPWAKVLSM